MRCCASSSRTREGDRNGPGTRSVKHLEENIAAGDIELDEQDMRRLDGATQLGNPAAPAER